MPISKLLASWHWEDICNPQLDIFCTDQLNQLWCGYTQRCYYR